MVIRPPGSVFRRLALGTLALRPEHFRERITSWGTRPPLFGAGRTERLRRRLLDAGIDPVSVGLPSPSRRSFRIPLPPAITYRDACREIKYVESRVGSLSLTPHRYDFVKQQMAQMSSIIAEWRQVRHKGMPGSPSPS